MKLKTILTAALISFILGNVSAQEKGLKADTDKETVSISNIAGLLDSKTFEFIAHTVFPSTGSPKNLVGSSYSVTFSPEMIISNLPFYGRGNSGMALRKDTGMRFKGLPEDYIFVKKKEYQVDVIVNDEDTYEISLSVSDSGNAKLSISSNRRGTITYQGEVK